MFLWASSWLRPPLATEPPNYAMRQWTIDEGLPQNTIRCLLQTKDGYIWVGTKAGLARFDGVRFVPFTVEIADQQQGDLDCWQLAEDTAGRLWIRTRSRLIAYEGGFFRFVSARKDLLTDDLITMCPRRGGGLWVGTREGLLLIENERITAKRGRPESTSIGPASHVFEDTQGIVWVECHNHIYRFDPFADSIIPGKEFFDSELFPDKPETESMFQDSQGQLWLCTMGGLIFFENGKWHELAADEPLSHNRSSAILSEDSLGALWVATYSDVRRLDKGRSVRWDETHGMPDADIRCVYEDREGNLWMGTGSNGLIELRLPALKTFSRNNGLANEDVQTIGAGRGGRIWVSPFEGFEASSDQMQVFTRPRPKGFPERGMAAPVLEDHTAELWFGVGGHGLFRWNNGEITEEALGGSGAREKQVTGLFEDRSHSLWIGTEHGLFCRTNRQTRAMTEGLGAERIAGICQSPDGEIWVGTFGGGVERLGGKGNKRYTTNEHLLSNFAAPLFAEAGRGVWVSTANGLNRIVADKVQSVTAAQGLFDGSPFCMLADGCGRYWFNSSRGIFHVRQEQLRAVADGREARVNCVVYTKADGVRSSEGNGEFQPNACKTDDGRLWFCTTKGVVMVDPAKVVENKVQPPVVIEEVKADGEVIWPASVKAQESISAKKPESRYLDFYENTKLGPGRGGVLEFRYTANSFSAPEQVRFKYRLAGYESEWRTAGWRERTAFYTNLRPGQYRFEVTACNNHGVWNERPVAFSFSIAPRFTETGWFPASLVFSGAGVMLGVGLWRARWQKRTANAERLAAVEGERARIARDLHDDLGSSLTGIALELEAARKLGRAEGEQLETVASEARSLAHQLRELAWATNPRCDNVASLGSFLGDFTERVCQAAGLDCKLELPETDPAKKLSARTRHELLLVLKESLTNITKHARARTVTLKVEITAEEVTLEVHDNGAGFDLERCNGGTGLLNMRERVEQMGGSFRVESKLSQGTGIRASLPLDPGVTTGI